MALQTPYGVLSEPLLNARNMLAHCAEFQRWIEEGTIVVPPEEEDGDPTVENIELPTDPEERAAAAAAYVYIARANQYAFRHRHMHAVIFMAPKIVSATDAVKSGGSEYGTSYGRLTISFKRNILAAHRWASGDTGPDVDALNDSEAMMDFMGYENEGEGRGLAKIEEEFKELQDAGAYLICPQIEYVDIGFCPEEEEGSTPWIGATWLVQWGLVPE